MSMSDPFPAGGYGPATWTDYNNNWRKADTDWLQTRAILRYQSGPPASGEIGQMVYDFAADKVVLRSKDAKWIPVVAAENLKVEPVTSSSPSEGVGLTHKAAAGQGLVFVPSEIIAYQTFRTGASEVVIDSTGLTLKTGAATAKLNTDAVSLVSSMPFTAPGLVSTSTLTVSGLSTLFDINARDGSFSRNVSVTGTLGVTGLVTTPAVEITTTPASDNRATNKLYVDAQVNTRLTQTAADARYVNLTGDTMTGQLHAPSLRLKATSPEIEFYNAAVTDLYGFIEMAAASALIRADSPVLAFASTGAERMRLSGASLLIAKTASDLNVAGVEIHANGASAEGSIRSTLNVSSINLYCRHMSGADVGGSYFAQFTRSSAGTVIGSISQNGTSGVNFNETSDYRQKAIVGPISNAIERIMALKPWRVTWIDDIARGETDAFIAHELAEVIPDAVTGERDAMLEDGSGPVYQEVDYSKSVILLAAGLQNIIGRVEALEAPAPTV